MTNYNMESYEIKREIVEYSKKLSEGLTKAESKFILDMQYGFGHSGSVHLSNIARALKEKIPLAHTIDRLSINLNSFKEDSLNVVQENYFKMVKKQVGDEALVLLDDSDIAKPYGKAFEDLALVRDGSALKETMTLGYNVCEAVVVSKNLKQPLSLYSEIYSTTSDGFKSVNTYTKESIEVSRNVLKGKAVTFVADRGYDSNWFIDIFLSNHNYNKKTQEYNDHFILRMKENRSYLFKGKSKNGAKEALKRKGKIRIDLTFRNQKEKVPVYVSHTKVELSSFKNKKVTLVFVYGLSETRPMILLTNKDIKNKDDVLNIVRAYMSRWRIEEYFRFKKQEYGLEGFRVRKLKRINTLNKLLTYHIGMIGLLSDKLNTKLLGHKIIERSKSIKTRVVFWYYQMSRGIKEILSYTQKGIEVFQRIESPPDYVQLSFEII